METKTTKNEAKGNATTVGAKLTPTKEAQSKPKPRLGRILALGEGEKDKTLATKTATEPKAKKEKPQHACPCCGKPTKGTFAMGHDGRVHGLLLRVMAGKMAEAELPNDRVRAMFRIFRENTQIGMCELARRTATEAK